MNISPVGKFLDQPLLISKLKDKTPKILGTAAVLYGTYDTLKAPNEERKKKGIKNAVILSFVTGASLISSFGLKAGNTQLFKGLVNVKNGDEILRENSRAVDKFLKKNKTGKDLADVLNKAKDGILSLNDTKNILKLTDKKEYKGKEQLLDTLFSKKENLSAKEIFKETGRLSALGLIPVISGVAGGVAADKAVGDDTPKSALNKVKEGTYQFLANIFMCNVGAAAALFGAERLHQKGMIKSLTPAKKLAVIMGGIFVTGIMGGSIVANYIGKKVLDPIFERHNGRKEQCPDKFQHKKENIYDERKPELLDMALHTDDIATAGVLSGFKWIEPMLPLMYTVSGYRAGIGYRNNGRR